ncbi:BatD family protein [Altibacter sp. HG106]|uniref:BatD family protein n=1 Tax=Altibacter sp. HG106 TaxID=3023937 RepID=UPI002350A0D3|nr:BatD family protein [Altibacter sp. HG106]MDC7994872.1 BatD family protein [Altibacter sp. HG106]
MKRMHAFLLLCLLTFGVTAQVSFEAKVSKKQLGINERLRIDFEMNQDGDNFTPPDFDGFRVVGGPNQAISNSYINGKRSYSKTYSYFLSPLAKGTVTINQATIEIDGDIYKTTPVTVTITEAVERPKDGNDAEYVASENVHLVAEVSKTNPYLNESLTVVYKLYVSDEVSITSNWREIDTPKYADFWSQNIDTQGNFKIYEGTYEGRPYRYVILRTTVLYPQKTGELEIEPLVLDVPIDVQSNRRDLFGRRLMTRVNKTISAGKRTINVKPLPEEGKPVTFSGAVGEFDFNVTSDKTTLDANESLELNIEVSGSGNLKLFNLPSAKTPSSLEVYDPERSEEVRTTASGMRGSVSESYVVVPQAKGIYPIRPISFSFFNPKTETYETRTSEEIVITVENGPAPVATNEENTTVSNNQTVVTAGDTFKYIKLNSNLTSVTTTPFLGSRLFWILLVAPFLLIPLFILIGKKRKERRADIAGNRLRKANRLAKKYLSEAKKNLTNKAVFYESLERALHNYLRAKLSIETSEFSKERIDGLLQQRGVDEATVASFITLLKSCELARYTPTTNVAIQQDYEKAVSVLSEIDKQLK